MKYREKLQQLVNEYKDRKFSSTLANPSEYHAFIVLHASLEALKLKSLKDVKALLSREFDKGYGIAHDSAICHICETLNLKEV